ncbi:MAG: hypothetical protein ACO2OS_04400 [Thermosphaera aggregans]|uniref:hypothetical protein n=1 Tax=Thermosphaera aggregans TaxID=54254 RepID=UPI003C0CBA36
MRCVFHELAKPEYVLRLGRKLVSIMNSIVILLTSIIMLVTLGIISRDTYQLIYNFSKLEFTFIQNMANEILFLFVYIEIVKSAFIARKHPGM